MSNTTRVIVLHDTQDKIHGEWLLAGSVLFNATITNGGYEGEYMGNRYEVYAEDAAVMLSDN